MVFGVLVLVVENMVAMANWDNLCGSFFLSFFVISNLRFSLSDVVEESWGISPFDQS